MGNRKARKRFTPPPPRPAPAAAEVHWEWASRVELLAQQFSDQFAFVREAVCNSILSGSHRVAVTCLEQQPECEIRIEDWGCGIALEVIQQVIIPITRGEWDFRKSDGKGLGFISCFALAPHRLVLESLSHRVEFRYQKTVIEHEITTLEEPRQGTRIRWFKALDPPAFREYQEQVRRILGCWFHDPKAEILLDGVDVRDPRPIQHPLHCRWERPGLILDVWPSLSDRPLQEYLRDGMVLSHREEPSVRPGVAFRIDCSELRPTVTRDGVVRDRALENALREVRRLVDGELLPRLLASREGYALEYLSMHPKHCRLPLLSGGWIKLRDLDWTFNLWDGIYWDHELTDQSRALVARGIPVLKGLEGWMETVLSERKYRLYQASTSPPPAFQGVWERVFRLYSKLAWS